MKNIIDPSLPERTVRCLNLLGATRHVPGDIYEFGTYQGVTAIAMAQWIKINRYGKKVLVFDTFEGLPEPGGSIDPMLRKGECFCPYEEWEQNVVAAGVQDIIVPIKGRVEDTLPEHIKGGVRVSFAFLDLDLYAPTSFVVQQIKPMVSLGGILGFHDYGFVRCPGVKVVVDQELNSGSEAFRQFSDTAYDCAFMTRIR